MTRYGHLTDEELLREGLGRREMDEFTLELWDRLARKVGNIGRAAAQQAEDDSA